VSPPGEDRFGDGLYDDETVAAIEGWERPPPPAPPPSTGGWRRSAAGAVFGAALLGLGEALEGRALRERPPIVADDPGEVPDPDALVDVDFDPASPAATTARHLRRG
jgi:hypothetical protein